MPRKRNSRTVPESILEAVADIQRHSDRHPENFSTLVCLRCGGRWSVHILEDAQYLHAHRCLSSRCPRADRKVLRLSCETIGSARVERDDLAFKRRDVLAGKLWS